MGFFDSMKKSFDEEKQKSSERKANSTYNTVAQRESDHYNGLDKQSDGALLGKFNSLFTSDKDKKIIAKILESRGYEKRKNGAYGRR